MSGEINNSNKYSVYRNIRYRRTYRTLGRMSWWRIALGLALLVFVFFLSGTVSSSLAARGHFKAAERLIVSPRWMEQYRPELKAFIEAGVLYEDGDYEGALSRFDALGDVEAARAMRSVTAVRLAQSLLDGGDCDGAFEAITKADAALLSESGSGDFRAVCEALCAHYAARSDSASRERAARLASLLDAQ